MVLVTSLLVLMPMLMLMLHLLLMLLERFAMNRISKCSRQHQQ